MRVPLIIAGVVSVLVLPFLIYYFALHKEDFRQTAEQDRPEATDRPETADRQETPVANETVIVVQCLEDHWNRIANISEVKPLVLGKGAVHAIVVPYRDRKKQLDEFLQYMRVFLKRFSNDRFHVYIIEQDDEDKCFNRGLLFNVGFLEASKREKELGCVVLHDVDRLPLGDVDYTRCSVPVHLAQELEELHWKTFYAGYCGGVVIASANHTRAFNGMSNDYRGWGGEDDDMLIRMKHVTSVATPPPSHGMYYHITENHTERIKCTAKNPAMSVGQLLKAMQSGSDRWKSDGLNSVRYIVKQTETLVADFAFLYKVVPQYN